MGQRRSTLYNQTYRNTDDMYFLKVTYVIFISYFSTLFTCIEIRKPNNIMECSDALLDLYIFSQLKEISSTVS